MRTRFLMLLGLLAPSGCGLDAASGLDAVITDEGGRRLESVSLLLTAVVAEGSSSPWSEHVGEALHPSVLRAGTLTINGRSWAPLVNADADTAPPADAVVVGGIALGASRTPALLVAQLGEAPVADPEALETVSDWVELLGRVLGVGSYIAGVEGLGLRDEAPVAATVVGPIPRVPLEVVEGEVARHLGQVEVALRLEAQR